MHQQTNLDKSLLWLQRKIYILSSKVKLMHLFPLHSSKLSTEICDITFWWMEANGRKTQKWWDLKLYRSLIVLWLRDCDFVILIDKNNNDFVKKLMKWQKKVRMAYWHSNEKYGFSNIESLQRKIGFKWCFLGMIWMRCHGL